MSHVSLGKHHPVRLVALGLFAVVALASCEVGWVNPTAGDGTAGTTSGTVPDAQAQFSNPTGVVAIPGGGFYVYDAATCAIYKESHGQTSVYAGTPGTCGNTGDGGSATSATLDNTVSVDPSTRTARHGAGHDFPTPMALGPDGSLYFTEVTVVSWTTVPPDLVFPAYRSQVRRISPDGTITAVGSGVANSLSNIISGLTTTPDGTVVVATSNGPGGATQIDEIAPDGSQTAITAISHLVYAIAAISDTEVAVLTDTEVDRVDLTNGAVTSTGQATSLLASSIAAAPDGTIYVGGMTTNELRRISPDDSMTVIAGNGTADPGTSAQTGAGLSLHLTPTGLALTPNNGLLLTSGHVVYRLQDPSHAQALVMGSPLNYFGGYCAPFRATPTPTDSAPMVPCPAG